MKAAVIHKLGEIPKFEDVPEPVAQKEGEVVAKVKAASLKNIDKALVQGSHYSKPYTNFPCIIGTDAICLLDDGTRVLSNAFSSYGTMAEKTLVLKERYLPIPDGVDDIMAAALPNPGLSAWVGLTWRAQFKPGDTVLILGATGVTGKLAIQFAKQLGAGRVVAAGRNSEILQKLPGLGADAIISLAQSDEALKKEFAEALKPKPFDIVLDYVWGRPSEILLDAMTGHDLGAAAYRTRYVQVGAMAGSTIALPAAVLRSTGLELYGQGGGSIPREELAKVATETLPRLLNMAAEGKIQLETEQVPLHDIEQAWQRTDLQGKRIVIIP